MRISAVVVVILALHGLPGCSFCPDALEPTAADKAAGLACHFTPEQQRVYEERLPGLLHPAYSSW
jgi:hypothetical protein